MTVVLILVILGIGFYGYRKVRSGASWAQLVAGAYGVGRELFTFASSSSSPSISPSASASSSASLSRSPSASVSPSASASESN